MTYFNKQFTTKSGFSGNGANLTDVNAISITGFLPSQTNLANTVAVRNTDGTLLVSTPTAANHATTKAYVDDAVANSGGGGGGSGVTIQEQTADSPPAYLSFVNATSGSTASVYTNTSLTYTPSTNTINASLSGNATTATTATNQLGGTVSATTGTFSGQVTSTIAIGTAPFVVTSTTRVANLNVANAEIADSASTVIIANTTSNLDFKIPFIDDAVNNASKFYVSAKPNVSLDFGNDSYNQNTPGVFFNPTTDTLKVNNAEFSETLSHGGLLPTSGSNIDQVITISNISVPVSATSWTSTTVAGTAIQSGMYNIVLSFTPTAGQEYYFSGTMSWFSGAITGTSSEEIVLHGAGYDLNKYRLYARLNRTATASTLQLIASSNDGTTIAPSVTLKLRRIL